MTHFYIQIAMDGNTPKRDTIEKVFLGNFKLTEFSKENNCVILSADFLNDNFRLEKKDTNIKFQINTKKMLAIKEPQKEKKVDTSYSPVITINTKTMDVEIKTDPFGAHLVYIVALENGKMVISSHMKYIIAMHPELLNELDYNALVEYLFCHSILGVKTYFKKIRLLPGNSKNQTATEISELLKAQMKNFAAIENVELAFLLSGGLDSRLLISAIDKKWKKSIETYTFDSLSDGKEIKYAKGVSDILSVPHHYKVISDVDVLKYCFKHMWHCEGLSNHVISIRHALYEKVNGEKLFFDGLLGDGPFGGNYLVYTEKLVRKYMSPERRLMENLIANEYAFPKRKFYAILDAPKDQTLQILEQGMQEQRNLLWEIDNESLRLEYLLTQTRARGYMLGGSRSFSHLASINVPYTHPEIISSYLKVPPKLRKKRKLELLTLKHLNKELA
ncbi:MAG: asparagine synthase-related protein [Candidatus Heimdallarchaeota archaeon]